VVHASDRANALKAPEVVIIGAGIVGVSAAIWLQRAGINVTLLDKGGPASGTSYGNAGVLAAASVVPVTVPGLIGKAPRMLLDKSQPLFLNWSYLPRLMPWLPRYLSHCNPKQVNKIAKVNGLREMLQIIKSTILHLEVKLDMPHVYIIMAG